MTTEPGDCRVCNTAVHPRCEHCPGGSPPTCEQSARDRAALAENPDDCAVCGSPYHQAPGCPFRTDPPHAE